MGSSKRTIAYTLFRNVFVFYLLIATLVIGILTLKQYMDAKDRAVHILEIYEKKHTKALAGALWAMDMQRLTTLSEEIQGTEEIVGVSIRDHHAEETFISIGLNNGAQQQTNALFNTYYAHEFPIDFQHETGTERVGVAAFYTSSAFIFSTIASRIYLMAGAVIIMLVALWVILFYVSRRILSHPLSRLTALTKNLELSNLEEFRPTTSGTGKNELEVLEDAFASMIQRLRRTKEALAQSHAELEQRVDERTAELKNEIFERQQAEEMVQTLSQAIEQSPVSVVITDPEANIEYVNNTFERVTGYGSAEVIGRNPRFLQSGNTTKSHYSELWRALACGQAWQGEFQNQRKNGEIFWEYAHIAPVLDQQGNIRHILGVKEDITLRKQQEERILRQAYFDSLTDLPNRFLALDRLSQLIIEADRTQERIAVLFLDLDDFKKVNDTLGHETGDKLLQLAAKRLKQAVREDDTIGRLGGDEFIALLGGLSTPQDAIPVAEKLLDCFKAPFLLDNRDLVLTASVGIAVYPENGKNATEMLRNADTAMYHSKDQGRNTFHYFTSEMNVGVARRLMLEEQLRNALDNQELFLSYQPLIDIRSRSLVGVEALLRWNNPALGSISPEEFIPIAEQTGLILPIGEWVLEQALINAALWVEKTPGPFKIAVNLSPRQFREPNLVPMIKQALQNAGLKGCNLELEITEGVLMDSHSHIDDALGALCQLGIGIAIDDFGTGYSSLSYLRNYPFHTLKIDRSFINDINRDTADRELVNAAIAMAHSLGLQVVAEGVETEGQLAHLASQDCDIAQGYLFSRPVAAEEISRLLERGGVEATTDGIAPATEAEMLNV